MEVSGAGLVSSRRELGRNPPTLFLLTEAEDPDSSLSSELPLGRPYNEGFLDPNLRGLTVLASVFSGTVLLPVLNLPKEGLFEKPPREEDELPREEELLKEESLPEKVLSGDSEEDLPNWICFKNEPLSGVEVVTVVVVGLGVVVVEVVVGMVVNVVEVIVELEVERVEGVVDLVVESVVDLVGLLVVLTVLSLSGRESKSTSFSLVSHSSPSHSVQICLQTLSSQRTRQNTPKANSSSSVSSPRSVELVSSSHGDL